MVHSLTFNQIYKERIWGGRNLQRLFGKPLPSNVNIGESWELADLPNDKSIVKAGPAAGKNIAELVKEWGPQLLGRAGLDGGQFPLLIKFLDANDILSVQVHPDYESARKLGGDVRAKYEAWYVMDAEEGAYVYIGLKPGTTRDDVERAVADGTLAQLLIKRPARRGDFFYLPGGTVHALGSGLVVAEVQTPSDTTFRLYDWNRVDTKTGLPRELHVEQALACIRFDEAAAEEKSPPRRIAPSASRQLACAPTFCITLKTHAAGDSLVVPTGEPLAWVVLKGSGTLFDGVVQLDLNSGRVVLMPACLSRVDVNFTSQFTCLEVKLTKKKND